MACIVQLRLSSQIVVFLSVSGDPLIWILELLFATFAFTLMRPGKGRKPSRQAIRQRMNGLTLTTQNAYATHLGTEKSVVLPQ